MENNKDLTPREILIPGLRDAKNGIYAEKCCNNCVHFASTPLAYPGGWCLLYKSKYCNTCCDSVCDRFKHIKQQEHRVLTESISDIVRSMHNGTFDITKYRKGDISTVRIGDTDVEMELVYIDSE